jgi:hypothetical protein
MLAGEPATPEGIDGGVETHRCRTALNLLDYYGCAD